MGVVTGAVVFGPDGTTRPVPGHRALQPVAEGELVELIYDYGPGLVPAPGEVGSMWRYRALLPLDRGPIAYPLPVGGTPLLAPPGLRRALGAPNLHLKDESRGPSGSNKDRATALVLEHGLRAGVETVSCASTGNVAVSLALGAAAAGLRAVIFVPAGVEESKLRLMLLAGATVVRVDRGYGAAFELSRRAAREFGWLDRNTGLNPLTLEAKKTVAFEIWEQLGRRPPDVVLAPVGDGPTLWALARGFRELRACGATSRLPRLIGVQAAGCQPVKVAFETGTPVKPVEPHTVADGIAVGRPVAGARVVEEVRASAGGLVAVEDREMLEAIDLLARRGGVIAEPAGAAALAGLIRAREQGLVGREEVAVVLVTGTGLKTPRLLPASGAAIDVQGSLEEVAGRLGPSA
ncbi:MAG TPA: threonine synthase [Candidatus Dormibacteraeota bacterium]|jgi:threonine synthase|nr:threonine synthase [Candidatus Dormibacteraeota bacterium]